VFPPTDTWHVSSIKDIATGAFTNARIERGVPNRVGPLGHYGDIVHISFGEHRAIYRIGETVGNRVKLAWVD
jgi:hypothetical protein